MINKGMMTSETPEWATPQWLFDKLDERYHFTLDPCSTHENAKCEKHYTKEQNGLTFSWAGERVFVNPPYGREIGLWTSKCFRESENRHTLIVTLLPARTDTAWFHSHIYGKAKIGFIRGRLKFGEGKGSAPFPSMIAAWGEPYDPVGRDEFIFKFNMAMRSIQERGTKL